MNILNCFVLAFAMLAMKKEPYPENDAIKAKLVYSSCATIVVQVEDSDYFYLGQSKWQRTPSDLSYENVFMVRNSCNFIKSSNIAVGEEFYFKVVSDQVRNSGCTQCLMYDNPPTARLSIEVVTKVSR